jgi:uncharacterized phiE125 gp8 family phage protein
MLVPSTTTNLLISIHVNDDAGDPVLALAFDTAGLVVGYRREADATYQTITLVAGTVGAYLENSWAEVGLGEYQLCLPNAALEAGKVTKIKVETTGNSPQFDSVELRLGSGGGSSVVTSPGCYVRYTASFAFTAGVTGDNILIDRLNYGSSAKVWPVDQSALSNHLQLDHHEDDSLVFDIGGYLASATADCENRANKALIRQKRIQTIGWDLLAAGLSGLQIYVSTGPVLSITAVKYLDADGVEQSMPTTNYRLLPDKENLYFYGDIPAYSEGPGAVWVEYEAGYGDTPAEVPSEWQSIVSQLAFRKYDLRGGDSGGSNDSFERMIDRMIVIAGGSRRG